MEALAELMVSLEFCSLDYGYVIVLSYMLWMKKDSMTFSLEIESGCVFVIKS